MKMKPALRRRKIKDDKPIETEESDPFGDIVETNIKLEIPEDEEISQSRPSQKKIKKKYEEIQQSKIKPKKHVCDECGKAYQSKWSLQEHLVLHTGEMNYHCLECGKKFSHQKNLNAHMEVRHIKTKFYYCNICGRQFNRKNNMHSHQRIHDDEGKLKCTFADCNKIFKWENSLKAHLISHENAPSQVCEICNKHFKHSNTLKKHCMKVHGGLSQGIKSESE